MIIIFWLLVVILLVWGVGEIGTRLYAEKGLSTDFYSSLARYRILNRQKELGVKTVVGIGWIHLGWIADPERESYRVMQKNGENWEEVGWVKYGSFLQHGEGGQYAVWAVPKNKKQMALNCIGYAAAKALPCKPIVYIPRQAGEWQNLFKPEKHGYYINDHTIYQDREGNWRLVGITSKTEGDFSQEKYFAAGMSPDFPPGEGDIKFTDNVEIRGAGEMAEQDPINGDGSLTWAPHVIREGDTFYLFWSPHKLHRMSSNDGIHWGNHRLVLPYPFHKFFRDAIVFKIAEGYWLMVCTARGLFFSQVDLYQSFNLHEWQYIRTALCSRWGSERNSPFASMESPCIVNYQGGFYLALTYNNDTPFWHGILLLFRKWLNPASYNETLVFYSDNPFDFGIYRGKHRSPTLVTTLQAHAAEIIHNPLTDRWYLTTCGWKWVSSLTQGEAAVALLEWERQGKEIV